MYEDTTTKRNRGTNLIYTNSQNRHTIRHVRHACQTIRAITNTWFDWQSYNRDRWCKSGHHARKMRGTPGGSDDDLDAFRAGFLGVLGHQMWCAVGLASTGVSTSAFRIMVYELCDVTLGFEFENKSEMRRKGPGKTYRCDARFEWDAEASKRRVAI